MSKSQEELRYVMHDRLCLMAATAILQSLGVLTFAIGVIALSAVEDGLVAVTLYVIVTLFVAALTVAVGLQSAVETRLRREREVCELLGYQPPGGFAWIFRAGIAFGVLAVLTMIVAAMARGVPLMPF